MVLASVLGVLERWASVKVGLVPRYVVYAVYNFRLRVLKKLMSISLVFLVNCDPI